MTNKNLFITVSQLQLLIGRIIDMKILRACTWSGIRKHLGYFRHMVYARLTFLSCMHACQFDDGFTSPLILYLPAAHFELHFWRSTDLNPKYSVPHFKMTSKIFRNMITLRVLTIFWLAATITFPHVWREATLQLLLFPHLHIKNANSLSREHQLIYIMNAWS